MDIFNTPTPTSDIDPAKDYYTELVGEGKKFADNAALARAKVESDKFIQRILDEKRQLEEDLKTRTNMQDFLDQMKTAIPTPVPTPVTTPIEAPASGLTPEQIEALVQQQIVNREAETNRSRNLLTVQAKLQETLGAGYAEQVKERARTLGLDIQYFNDTAAKSPQAFFELMGLNRQREDIPSLPRSAVGLPHSGGVKKNFAYFNQMRKENPVQYHNPSTQKEMWKLAADPSFYD